MVLVNNTRDKTHSLKKSRSVASATLDFSDTPLTADDYELFVLPEDAIITDAFYVVDEAYDAATTADMGVTQGGSELVAAGAVDAAGVVAANDLNLLTGTGNTVYLNMSADVTQGKMIAVVEYVEYQLHNGDLTNFSDTV